MKNICNKVHLLTSLKDRYDKKGFNVIQSSGDADLMTCTKALDSAKQGKLVELHEKVTESLINVILFWQHGMILYFPAKRNTCTILETTMWWNVKHIVTNESLHKKLLFVLVWRSCVTTSAIGRQREILGNKSHTTIIGFKMLLQGSLFVADYLHTCRKTEKPTYTEF